MKLNFPADSRYSHGVFLFGCAGVQTRLPELSQTLALKGSQQTWKSGFYRIYGASQRQPTVRLCWVQGKSHPLDSDFFFWKLPDLDFPTKIKHSALRKKHETKSHTLYVIYVISQPRLFKVCFCVFVFFLFSWFSSFSSFLCFSLVCVILVIIKVKDAARIDTAFAKVFVSNSLCYCEFLVSGPPRCRDPGYFFCVTKEKGSPRGAN